MRSSNSKPIDDDRTLPGTATQRVQLQSLMHQSRLVGAVLLALIATLVLLVGILFLRFNVVQAQPLLVLLVFVLALLFIPLYLFLSRSFLRAYGSLEQHEALQQKRITELSERFLERTRQLEAERAQMNAILDAMTEGVIYQQGETLVYKNYASQALLGYAPGDWPGLRVLMVGGGAREQYEELQQGLREHGHWRGEVLLQRKGSPLDAHLTAVQIRDFPEPGVVVVVRDISQQKALQEQRTRFVAYASHELRTPLANLKTRMYLLQRQPEQFLKHFRIIQDVVSSMERLVNDLLMMSRFERGLIELHREVVSLSELVKRVVEMHRPQAQEKSIALTVQVETTALYVHVDPDRIGQVLTNLIANAINYTPDGGSVHVTLQATSGNQADILVEDTGIGIPDDALEHIFQPFYRVDDSTTPGTGLGLSISRHIVDLHKGTLSVQSTLGEGSRFTLRLPLASPELVRQDATRLEAP